MKQNSIPKVFFSKIAGLLLFLVILAVANLLIPFINNEIYFKTIYFFNNNLLFLVILSVIFLIGALFDALFFPFNLPAPIFNAIGGVLVAVFVFRIFGFIDLVGKIDVFRNLSLLAYLIYFLIFVFVIIFGYIGIFAKLFRIGFEEKEPYERPKRKKEKNIKWTDVADQFKLFFYNVGKVMNESFSKNKKNKK
jgi:hypothetical protein